MKKFETIEEIAQIEPSCVALGNFDGVHVGHRQLIESAVKKAKEKGLASAVFTFSNHPKSLIPGAKPVKNIVYREEKEALIEAPWRGLLFQLRIYEGNHDHAAGGFRENVFA